MHKAAQSCTSREKEEHGLGYREGTKYPAGSLRNVPALNRIYGVCLLAPDRSCYNRMSET